MRSSPGTMSLFWQRWGFAIVASTGFMLIYFALMPDQTSRCRCRALCAKLMPPHGSNCNCKGKTGDIDPKRPTKLHKSGRGPAQRPELRREGWIVDCVTWNQKWESPPLDADPHEFLWDETKLKNGEPPKQRLKIFNEIYHKRHWDSKDPYYYGLQVSGPGAMLKNAQSVIASLHVIIAKTKAYLGKSSLTLLDLACGDLQWMSKFLITRDDIEYTGADMVPDLIHSLKEQFSSLPKAKFMLHDIISTPLNDSYDIVICRDVLQFLWQADALRALNHISSSGSKFLLATTFPDTTQNDDQNEKDFSLNRKYPYNLELPPFLLEPPICTSYDWNIEHLGLWELPIKQKYEY